MKRRIAALLTTAALAGGTLLAASPAYAADAVISVPADFVKALSDTRATGHFSVVGTELLVRTEGNTSTDKVAEYVAADKTLAEIGEPSLTWNETPGNTWGANRIAPGFQLVVDFDADGTPDGILVGEKVYNGDWWASNGSAQFVKDGAPSHEGGSGSANHGTLDQWRAKFPKAEVAAFGFSLGSGVFNSGTISKITFAGTDYRFTDKAPVVTEPTDPEESETPAVIVPAAPVPPAAAAPAPTLAETGVNDEMIRKGFIGALMLLVLGAGIVVARKVESAER